MKERNCVQLIFSYQIRTVNTFQRLRLSIMTSILEKAVKVKAFNFVNDYKFILAGGDIRQKLEFHHVHLELGALGYIETFLFYWSWGSMALIEK